MSTSRRKSPEQATAFAQALASQLERYRGRRLLGVVDGLGVVEVVWSDEEGEGHNLLSFPVYEDGTGPMGHGFVVDPEDYIEKCGLRPNRGGG